MIPGITDVVRGESVSQDCCDLLVIVGPYHNIMNNVQSMILLKTLFKKIKCLSTKSTKPNFSWGNFANTGLHTLVVLLSKIKEQNCSANRAKIVPLRQ